MNLSNSISVNRNLLYHTTFWLTLIPKFVIMNCLELRRHFLKLCHSPINWYTNNIQHLSVFKALCKISVAWLIELGSPRFVRYVSPVLPHTHTGE